MWVVKIGPKPVHVVGVIRTGVPWVVWGKVPGIFRARLSLTAAETAGPLWIYPPDLFGSQIQGDLK